MSVNPFFVAHAVFKRTWIKTLRRPVTLTFSLVQPLMWMLFFGFLFQRYALEELPSNIQYLDFLVPGVCAMTVLFGASQSGIELIRDMQTRFLERVIATPASAVMLALGKISADVSRLLIQALMVLALGVLLGAQLHINASSLFIMLGNLLLLGIIFCSLSCWIALIARSQEYMATFVHLVNMPLLFTSTALVPSRQMPDWLGTIAEYNPLSLVVNNLRSTLLFGDKISLIQSSSLELVALAILSFLLTVYALHTLTFN